MAVGKEIKKKIGSVQNTQKITSAMQMVAASKMRRTQDKMRQGKSYSSKIREVISHLASSNPEYTHEYMKERPDQNIGYIVVATDRGLCGGLNVNLFRSVVKEMGSCSGKGGNVELGLIGNKHFFGLWREYNSDCIGCRRDSVLRILSEGLVYALKPTKRAGLMRLWQVMSLRNTMTQTPNIRQLYR